MLLYKELEEGRTAICMRYCNTGENIFHNVGKGKIDKEIIQLFALCICG